MTMSYAPAATARGRVRLNVGGRIFETTADTLASAGRDTMLGAMVDASWNPGLDPSTTTPAEYFIDRDPACFAVLLDLLRTGALHLPPTLPEPVLCRDALYYGLLDRVRAARIPDLDADRLRLAASVPGRAPGDGTAVRAAPDGGCCVAHGAAGVRVYSWILEERAPVHLDHHAPVNDAAYLDASTLLVAAQERPAGTRGGGGGVAAFSALTGRLRHRFLVAHGRQPRPFTATALASGSKLGMMTSGKSFKARDEEEETCYPKLAVHGGRLFASMSDAVSVFSGPDHVHTSTLRGSGSGGGICDFSVGGDRIFVLHNDENVFDVWETPPPPVI
ncbi:hypothetical protein PR202_gb09053 [Eleusine coracana subsp. coracana]|uniref:BTB domain-containing protein n=1 Tax=Eleusine coracana subsp. coracana TaxID=191504 RepID=A0AAV5EG93_ELECO|nr:hypothetical protein PR202_gb09053 [Eleusine coracana subsp. coracana]